MIEVVSRLEREAFYLRDDPLLQRIRRSFADDVQQVTLEPLMLRTIAIGTIVITHEYNTDARLTQ